MIFGKKGGILHLHLLYDIKSLTSLRDPAFKSSWNILSSSPEEINEGWLWRRAASWQSELHPHLSSMSLWYGHFLTLLCHLCLAFLRGMGRGLDEDGDQKPNHVFFKVQLLRVVWLIGISDKDDNRKEIEQIREGLNEGEEDLRLGENRKHVVRSPGFWGAVAKDSFIRPIILLGFTSLFDLSPNRTATSATKLCCKCL